ncbi:MAG: right-handed parallel beta-helix repeat-containing protein [Kiritimatiellae bacterium]|nr:right-handed parallel beta-helix repeat-containing protein [Kiritimatiellia bacterium]
MKKSILTDRPVFSVRKRCGLIPSLPWRLMVMAAFVCLLWSGALVLGADTYYVATNGPGGGATTWATATNNIQDAISLTVAGDTVLVSNGVYETGQIRIPDTTNLLWNRVCVTNNITLRSVNGPDFTIIKGMGPHGESAVRCVYLTNGASLIGFTLTNGYTRAAKGDQAYDQGGGGVSLHANSVVSNCVITDNRAFYDAGGAYLMSGGTLNNCTLSRNYSDNRNGGGAYLNGGAVMNNCVLTGNYCNIGGGGAVLYSNAVMNNCTFLGNQGNNYAGGAYLFDNSVMNNCTLSGNWTHQNPGGGAYLQGNSVMNNCIVSGNTAAGDVASGGGVWLGIGGTLKNCLLWGNTAMTNAGGVYIQSTGSGVVINCTISGNTAGTAGGGVYFQNVGMMSNSIVWGNICVSSSSSNILDLAGNATIRYSDIGPPKTGTGNIGADPLFADTNSRNYRLSSTNSPCFNAGSNDVWMTDARDLRGKPRILYGTVDMGAYEYEIIYSGTIIRIW